MYGLGMTKRLTKNAWIDHGFEVLKNAGHEGLKADLMVKDLGVSRGSFYWHFKSLAEFHADLLTAWRVQKTESVIAELSTLPEGGAQLEELIMRSLSTPQLIEAAMRRWGRVNSDVEAAMRQVDQLRMDYLTSVLMGQGLDGETAKSRAVILIWAFIGRAFAPGFVAQMPEQAAKELGDLFLSSSGRKT